MAAKKLSVNINSWVMRYSMNSFQHMMTGNRKLAAESLEYQMRLGVEGRASAAFSYGIMQHRNKIRIKMPDGRYLTTLERSLDILDNCDDKATEYHDKTCRRTSPLAPHKYPGMLFALAEIQGRASHVFQKPEWPAAKVEERKKVFAEQMKATLARLEETESAAGLVGNIDPEVLAFMKAKGVALKPWPFSDGRRKMAQDLHRKSLRWRGEAGIPVLNFVGLIELPMPEYVKGAACAGCHYQADENFEAGFRPHY
jgi:hypothetical protein